MVIAFKKIINNIMVNDKNAKCVSRQVLSAQWSAPLPTPEKVVGLSHESLMKKCVPKQNWYRYSMARRIVKALPVILKDISIRTLTRYVEIAAMAQVRLAKQKATNSNVT